MLYVIAIPVIILLFIFADWFAKMVNDAIKSVTTACKQRAADQIESGKIVVERGINTCSNKLKSTIEGEIDKKSQAFQSWLDGLRK